MCLCGAQWLDKLTMPLPHAAVGLIIGFKLGRALGYGTGDFIADMRTIWGVEVTKVLGLGAPSATPEQLGISTADPTSGA